VVRRDVGLPLLIYCLFS